LLLFATKFLAGKLDDQFPVIWQTGSVRSTWTWTKWLANRAQVLKGFEIGEGEQFIKANDDVNKSQSSNDTFPTECTLYVVVQFQVLKN
jgi:fumarate hydratase class II